MLRGTLQCSAIETQKHGEMWCVGKLQSDRHLVYAFLVLERRRAGALLPHTERVALRTLPDIGGYHTPATGYHVNGWSLSGSSLEAGLARAFTCATCMALA